jgi:hypothetical protein
MDFAKDIPARSADPGSPLSSQQVSVLRMPPIRDWLLIRLRSAV